MTTVSDFRQRFEALRQMVEARLEEIAPEELQDEPSRVRSSMRYSLLDGGKRFRPLLTVLTTDALGQDPAAAVDAACAIEMVHTASVIIDDLPCMDDASLRRGHETNHRVFGEDIAILGAVALVSESFEVLAKCSLDPLTKVALTESLAHAIGIDGLCGGQERDLREDSLDPEMLDRLQLDKTASIFMLCLEAGARAAGVSEDALEPYRQFGKHAGLGFQKLDDLLDRLGSEATTGKNVHQDTEGGADCQVIHGQALDHLEIARRAIAESGADPEPFNAFIQLVMMTFDKQSNLQKQMAAG